MGATMLLRFNVFSATFLPEAYLPDFDCCTKHIDFWKRWSTGGIVEAGSSVPLDCTGDWKTALKDLVIR